MDQEGRGDRAAQSSNFQLHRKIRVLFKAKLQPAGRLDIRLKCENFFEFDYRLQRYNDLADISAGNDKIGMRGKMSKRSVFKMRTFIITIDDPTMCRVFKIQKPINTVRRSYPAFAKGGEVILKKSFKNPQFMGKVQSSHQTQKKAWLAMGSCRLLIIHTSYFRDDTVSHSQHYELTGFLPCIFR